MGLSAQFVTSILETKRQLTAVTRDVTLRRMFLENFW